MFICLDIETTGLSPTDDQVIEVAVVLFDHEKIIDKWSSLVKPSIPIPEFTERLTGINDEMVADAPKLEEIADQIREKVGNYPIMGHFIFFDLNFLQAKEVDLQNQQLDTCQLTQVLLHNEASYSLEVLTEKLGIEQPDAHRALGDCVANIELFWKLAAHIKGLSTEEKAAIKPILEKSNWPWAEHVLEIMKEEDGEQIPQSKTEKVIGSEKHAELTNLTQALPNPFLFEEASHTYQDLIDYTESLEEKAMLVVPYLPQLPEHKDLGIIKDPNQYIDENRLDNFLAGDSLDTTQTMLGAKAKLWLKYSPNGEKSEIRLHKEEVKAWEDICCQETEEAASFFKKAQENAAAKKIMAIDQFYFLKDRSRKEPQLEIPENLVIANTEQLVRKIESAWHIQLSESRFLQNLNQLKKENPDAEEVLDHIAGKISILFGMLGIVMQKHGEPENPWHTLEIEAYHQNTPEWNKVTGSAQSVESALGALSDKIQKSPTLDELERYLLYLSKILTTETGVMWMTLSGDEQIIVHAFPDNTSLLFKERVWKGIGKLHLFCHHADLADEFSFTKKELGLPEDLTCMSSSDIYPLPLVEVQTKVSSPNNPNNIKEVAHEIGQHVGDTKGNIFLLVTSKKSAEQFFYALNETAEESDRKLFVQNMSGGMGKIYKMSMRTNGQNIFVGNEGLLNFLLSEGVELSFLAVHRLPFSPPNSPIQKARAKDKVDAYKEFSLPQAALRFRGILSQFLGNKWEGKSVLVLDPRSKENEQLLY